MSFVPKSSSKDFQNIGKKANFYVEFLGWMECRGLKGQKYTGPVIAELRRRQRKMETAPKLTLQVSKKELKISQDVEDRKRKNIKKIKFPTIPARDVTYVTQSRSEGRSDDIVACIYLGYMPRTRRYVHIHVYRFDSPTTAQSFVHQMSSLTEANAPRIREIEIELAAKGEIDDPRLTSSDGLSDPHTTDSAVGSTSSAYSDEEPRTFESDEIDPDLISLKDVQSFDNVADELKYRLAIKETPLLLPPKDYDTISRAHGNLEQVNKRRCLNLNIVGENARDRNGSNESGVDLTSPISEHEVRRSPTQQNQSPFTEGFLPQNPPQNWIPQHYPGSQNSGSHNSGSTSPENGPGEFSYNVRSSSPGLSPRMYSQPIPQGHISMYPGQGQVQNPGQIPQGVVRQNSNNSGYGNVNGLPRYPDENLMVYKGGSANDIYAMPQKNKKNVLPEHYPPVDYSEDVQLRDGMRGHRQPNLTRSMPADMIRSEMALAALRPQSGDLRPHSGDLRHHSGDLRHMNRNNSPAFVGRGDHSPHVRRVPSHHR